MNCKYADKGPQEKPAGVLCPLQVAFGQIDERLVRNAARRVEPHQTHGATCIHAKHPATTEGATRNPSATGTVALVSLKLRATGRRAALSQVARFYSSDF